MPFHAIIIAALPPFWLACSLLASSNSSISVIAWASSCSFITFFRSPSMLCSLAIWALLRISSPSASSVRAPRRILETLPAKQSTRMERVPENWCFIFGVGLQLMWGICLCAISMFCWLFYTIRVKLSNASSMYTILDWRSSITYNIIRSFSKQHFLRYSYYTCAMVNAILKYLCVWIHQLCLDNVWKFVMHILVFIHSMCVHWDTLWDQKTHMHPHSRIFSRKFSSKLFN